MGIIIFILIGIVVLAALAGPNKCDVCGLQLKRKFYNWTVEGKKQKLCPKCNQQMERRVSKAAFNAKFK